MAQQQQQRPQDSEIVFIGTYTSYSVLPHWPHGGKEGAGIEVARWSESAGRLEKLYTYSILNPAFMK